MGANHITGGPADEIVFENRNKTYGAYPIRRSYDDSVLKSFGIAMFSLLSLILIYKLIPAKAAELPLATIPVNPPEPWRPPNKKKQVIITDDHTQVTHRKQYNQLITPIVVDSVDVKKKEPIQTTSNIPGPSNHVDTSGISDLNGRTGSNRAEGGTEDKGIEASQVALEWAEELPSFPGGEDALMRYLQRKIEPTQMAIDARVQGTMILQFVVDVDGSVKDVKVLRKVGFGLEALAIDVMKHMPRWKPGRMGTRAVPVYRTQPVRYSLAQ